LDKLQNTAAGSGDVYIALAGNPNSGKTSVFNALTGGRQKTANYAGVTVERKVGFFTTADNRKIKVIDLPGLYSLTADSPEEKVAQEILLGMRKDTPLPALTVMVLDATNMERNLYLALQVQETGVPVVLAMNMMDIARSRKFHFDIKEIEKRMRMPVIEMSAKDGSGIDELKGSIENLLQIEANARPWSMDGHTEGIIALTRQLLIRNNYASEEKADWLARRLLTQNDFILDHMPKNIESEIAGYRNQLSISTDDFLDAEVVNRYSWIRQLYFDTVSRSSEDQITRSEKADRIILNNFFGPIIFVATMAVMFQAIFSLSVAPIEWLENGVAYLSTSLAGAMTDGILKNLLLDGIMAGVGNIIVFLPQIIILFFFIALLEDTGYMSRAAFLLDKVMSKVGLNGHAFIPLLSSFACAVPGIMASRTIRNEKDRLTTILTAPLMTCGARLPVYSLLIVAFFPNDYLFGVISTRGLVLLLLYFGGIGGALLSAFILRRLIFKGERSPLILEMPSYKTPKVSNVWYTVRNAGRDFLKKAGTVILIMTIVIWFLTSHPKNELLQADMEAQGVSSALIQQELVKQSYLGHVGRFIEPAIRPLGYDWKIGVGLISAFSAREVIIGTLAIVYAASEEDTISLRAAMKKDVYPDGRPVWTPLVAASLLTFFIFALMCISTIATIKKEANSWKWAMLSFGYLFVVAYISALIVYQGGLILGFS
jgi:ferrous iron transport protein B